jgi:DNA repair exonuclease SbcCD ATPase subunit
MAYQSETNNFAKKISLEEYNKQKKEYTEKALLELKSQMATYKHNSRQDDNINDQYQSEENEDEYEHEYEEYIDDNTPGEASPVGVNVIIKTYQDAANAKSDSSSTSGLRRRKAAAAAAATKHKTSDVDSVSLSNTIYAQREIDLQELQKLKSKVKRLASALEEEERKTHFLKLDLCNAQVDVSDLKQALQTRDAKIHQLETKETATWWQIIKLKMFIAFMLIIYIHMIVF